MLFRSRGAPAEAPHERGLVIGGHPSLGVVLEIARRRYGEQFSAVLAHARVWVNGDEPADGEATVLTDDDEVAVLPPVSGG